MTALIFICSATVTLAFSCLGAQATVDAKSSRAQCADDSVSLMQMRTDLSQDRSSTRQAKPEYYWSGRDGNSARTSTSAYAVKTHLSPDASWNISFDEGMLLATPLIDDMRNIYVTQKDGHIHKFDINGKHLWKVKVWTTPTILTPILMDGSLFVASDLSGEIVSVDMKTGKENWRHNLPCCLSMRGSMTGGNGVVILAFKLQAYPFPPWDGIVKTPPADTKADWPLKGATVQVEMCNHYVCPIGWVLKKNAASIAGADHKLCCEAYEQNSLLEEAAVPQHGDYIVGLNGTDGSLMWKFEPTDKLGATEAAVEGSSVVFADLSGRTYSLELKTGNILWAHEFDASQNNLGNPWGKATAAPSGYCNYSQKGHTHNSLKRISAAVGPGKVVYVANNMIHGNGKCGGRLQALNLTTGDFLWQVETELFIADGPAVGRVHPSAESNYSVVLSLSNFTEDKSGNRWSNGNILAYDASNGKKTDWFFKQPPWSPPQGETAAPCGQEDFSGLAIGGDGTVYTGSGVGAFFAVKDLNGDGFTSGSDEVTVFETNAGFAAAPSIGPGMLVATPCNAMYVFRTF